MSSAYRVFAYFGCSRLRSSLRIFPRNAAPAENFGYNGCGYGANRASSV